MTISACSGESGDASETTAATPEPSPSDSASPSAVTSPWVSPQAEPLSTEPNLLGLKWNWTQLGTAPFVQAAQGGATFHKVEWCTIERRRGAPRNYDAVDGVVQRAEAMGYTVLLKIRIGSCWASAGSGDIELDVNEGVRVGPSDLPADLSSYAQFVTEFVQRYSAQGVHHYAIENEVDAGNFWSGSAEDYQSLARVGAAAVRSADPSAVVLDAGVSSTGYGVTIAASLLDEGREEEALAFYQAYYERRQAADLSRFEQVATVEELRRVVESNRGSHAIEAVQASIELVEEGTVDVYQLHFYESTDVLPDLLAWLDERLPEDASVQGWEVGVAWPGESYSEEEQSNEVARLLGTLVSGGHDPAVYLPVAFTPAPGKPQVFRGLVEPDGTPLPAATAFNDVLLATATGPVVDLTDDNGLRGFAAEGETETAAIIWAEPGSGLVLDVDGLSVHRVDGTPLADGAPVELEAPVSITGTLTAEQLLQRVSAGS